MVDYKLIAEIGVYVSMFYIIGKTVINCSSGDFSNDKKFLDGKGLESKIVKDKYIDPNLINFFHLSD